MIKRPKMIRRDENDVGELLPCPFCGGDNLSLDNLAADDDFFVECDTCQLGQHAIHTRDEAIEAWNRRE